MTPDAKIAREVLWLAGDRLLRYRTIETLTTAATALRACTDVDPTVREAFQAYQLDGSPAAKARLSAALERLMDTLHPEGVCTP